MGRGEGMEETSIETQADAAVRRYLDKKKKAEQASAEIFEQYSNKKSAAQVMADAAFNRLNEERKNTYTKMENRADQIFEKREQEAIDREIRIEQLFERVRNSETRLREEIAARTTLTIEIVHIARQQTMQRIEQEAQKAIERFNSSIKDSYEWIDEALSRLEIKKQKAKEEANRIADEIVTRVREKERLASIDAQKQAIELTKRVSASPYETDVSIYEPVLLKCSVLL
jgi:hypothetical protein